MKLLFKKTALLSLLSFFFLITPAYSQVATNQIYEITDFSKFLYSQVSPYLIPPNAAVEARNLRSNQTVGALTKRNDMLSAGSAGSFAITSLHRFYKSDDTKYLIVTGSTFIKADDDDDGTYTTIKNGLTDGLRWKWTTYKDMAIGVNGTDNPQKWDGSVDNTANTDGHRTANLLATDLGAPFAELNTGANLDASSWYQYRIVYYDGTTYQYSTSRSNPILTGAAVRDIALTDIPIGPSGTTHRYIYRTLGGADQSTVEADSTFYLVGTLANNTGTTLADNVTDATAAGDAAPTLSTAEAGTNITPPIGKYLVIHNERLWLARGPSARSDIYFSKAFLPDYFDTGTDFDQIRPDDGDEITCVENLIGILIVCKTNTMQQYLTDNTDTSKWVITDPMSSVGCPAPYSIVNTPLGLIYLGRDGIYVFNGERSELISDVVTAEIKDILQTSITSVAAIYANNEYQMAYTSQKSGSATNDTVLVFDIVRDAYILDDKYINALTVLNSGSDLGTIYSGTSAAYGTIFVHSTSPSEYITRYKSDLDSGTIDTAVVYGTQTSPKVEISWGITIDDTSLAGITINGYSPSTAIIERPDTTGFWFGPNTNLSATSFDKLYWHEDLGAFGDITFAIKAASTEGGLGAASWSSELTNPSGSDISDLTANTWIKLRTTLTTTDITTTPVLEELDNFVIKLVYNKQGKPGETAIETIWTSGFLNFGVKMNKKRIKLIEVHYIGSSGTLVFNLKNSEGDIDTSFNIDLSIGADDDTEDEYEGTGNNRIFTWEPPVNSEDNPTPIGEFWQFSITEGGVIPWTIYRIKVKYDTEELYEE